MTFPEFVQPKKNEFYRLNMPLELGIDIGCKLFKGGKHNQKKYLILEKERYRFQKALSDLAGYDIKNHNNEPEEIIRQIRDWFVENENKHVDSATRIWEFFNEFTLIFMNKESPKDSKTKI